MITCISYGDRKFKKAAEFNLETARLYGADKTILYGPKDLPLSFKLKNWRLYYRIHIPHLRPVWRGAGYWIWKSYIIKHTLESMEDGEFLVYSDGGAVYVNKVRELTDFMDKEQIDILVFTILHQEKCYSKRDAFVLLDADSPEYTETLQHPGGYIVLRKSAESKRFVEEWSKATLDPRIVSDSPNKMGKPNYPGFVENRHDQTSLSITAKKYKVKFYRDPSQWGNDTEKWPEDIIERSTYPQIWYSTRNPEITTMEKFKECVPNPYVVC